MKTKPVSPELELSQLEVNLNQNQLTLKARLSELCRTLVAVIALKPELQVWKTVNRAGNTWWNAYNPSTGKSANLGSEQEVRTWLEQSYYR